MSYGGQSNAPWQRNVMQGHPQSGGFHQGSQMFMQGNMAAYGHGGMQDAGGNAFPGSGGGGNAVAYPQPRGGLNPVAFQQGTGGPAQYNSIGTVTKISLDCGLVNDEVFFYRNVCKGPEPKLGDRVIFEASFSNNGQFKWNATRVQLMQQAQPLMSSNKGGYGSVAPPSDYQRAPIRRNSPKRSPIRGRHERDNRERERLHRSRERDEDEHERKRRREDHDRSRDRGAATGRGGAAHAAVRNEKERDRADSRKREREVVDREREDRERERERERARELELYRAGPKGRRARVKRYMVEIPRYLLTIKTADVQDLHQRYNSLYIPSDFFLANIKWSDSFTPDKPFSLRRPCQFHITHEMVENPNEQDPDLLEPADANYLFSAKVMLMALPPITEIYKKCFDNDDNDQRPEHPSRLINFLVGVKGRVGSMAIGGPWSPSLDGENPDKDPAVLIRTAIRTCKALTGIDLSNCTQWYRFVELYYHRTEYKNMGKDGPPRVETVVIYLPDVHSCMPSLEEWQTMTEMYKNAASEVIARRKALVAAAAVNEQDDNEKTTDAEMADNSTLNAEEEEEAAEEDAQDKSTDNEANTTAGAADDDENIDEADEVVAIDDDDEEMEKVNDSTASAATDNDVVEKAGAETEECANQDEDLAAEEENEEPIPEPTHYSLLELKAMKVQEIRDELLARGLPDKGVRNVVMARLAKALNTEKAEEIKNRKINKNQQNAAQKTTMAKKPQETNNKSKQQNDEKMDVDSETNTVSEKKATDKKAHDKKGATDAKSKTATKSLNNKKTPVKGKKEKNDKEDWADCIDFELSDIVILDEYDSSKCNEESNLKEMTEKEKSQLLRHYTLPTAPHIVVNPNRQAKGGKFDCAVVSLSVLLDYHPDDSKERFFEVSLFAELFNAMLMRDFGFTIYKEIYLHKDTEIEVTEPTKNENETKAEKPGEAGEEKKKESKEKDDDKDKDKSSKKDSKSANGEKSGKEQKTEDTHSIKSETRKRKLSTSTTTANGKDHDAPANDKKMVVVKPQLMLSFLFFDTNHCGYIIDKHLEDLFYVLGLNLSRSQIRTVLAKLGKLITPQPIHYRKLTEKEASLDSTPALEDIDDMPIEELERLAAGNNIYESVFGRNLVQNKVSAIEGESKDGLVNFNGAIVHVGKLLNQINRTEKNYSDLEKLYNDLLKQHSDLQKDHNKSTTKVKDLQAEIKSVSRKLTDANQDYYSLNRKYRDQHATLSYIYTRVEPYFAREKDKDAKTEKDKDNKEKEKDSKEKEKDSKEKEKEKEKDKTKNKESEKEKEKPKEEKDKEIKKEKTKEEHEKEAVKEEKEKSKEVKDEPKEENEKEKSKEENEVEEKEKEKPKEEKEKEKEKEKPKEDKVKQPEKLAKVVVKDKQPVKTTKEQPSTTKIENNNKPKDNQKPKPSATTTTNQNKPTPQKTATAKSSTPAAKKLNDNKSNATPAKIIKKSDNAGAKK